MGSNKKMKNDNLSQLIAENKWVSIVKEFKVDKIPDLLGYKDSMTLAYDLFFENLHDDDIQEFAVDLFFALKKGYTVEWNSDWKNNVFLGKLCSITWRYDEMCALYKEAYESLNDPPESLLLLLASCNSVPGIPSIDEKASEIFLQRAMAKKMTYEAALMMKGRAQESGTDEIYWENVCLDLKKRNRHTEIIIPDVLLQSGRG